MEGGECESVIVAARARARAPLFERRLRSPHEVRRLIVSFFLGRSLPCPRAEITRPSASVRPSVSPSVRLRLSVHLNRCVYCEILALGMECCYQILDGSRM